MPYMYILECADGSYYTGSTKDLERRLWEHQNGFGAEHTAKRLPVKLVYCEDCDHIDDAFYREKQVQGWSRKKKEALMVSDTNQLHLLAACQNETHCGNVSFGSGFDSAHPTAHPTAQPTDSAFPPVLPTDNRDSSLSGVETGLTDSHKTRRSLRCRVSGAEPGVEGCALSGVEGCALSGVEGCALSGVEGENAEANDKGIVE